MEMKIQESIIMKRKIQDPFLWKGRSKTLLLYCRKKALPIPVSGAIVSKDRKRKPVYFNRKCISWLPEVQAVAFVLYRK